ncbi:MAG: FtsX-like permease family protein [Lawsonibacter sp.]|jgi:putative ABC transport system permease protein
MFCKLALRNVRRSFRDYGIYFLTLTFGVCLFYTFNSVDGQGAMLYLTKSRSPMVEVIQMLIDIFSVFVAVVLACLILYANRFLLRRRKGELGTYLLLGLSQGQVARVLFLETGLIGLLSLAVGLGLGIPASWELSSLTLSMFDVDMSNQMAVQVSPHAMGKTLLYFGLIFVLVMVFNALEVSRSKLIDLIRSQRKNEVYKPHSVTAAVVQLLAGVVCLIAAYAILLTFGMAIAVAVLPICIPMLGLGTLGTLLIFRSLSGFVLRLVQNHPGIYYRKLNLFTLRQWMSKVHTTYLSQTVICILLLLAMGITASCVGLNSTLETLTDTKSSFDITVQNQSADQIGLVDFPALLQQNGGPQLEWQYSTTFYYNDPEVTGLKNASAAIAVSDLDALRNRVDKPAYAGELPQYLEDLGEIPVTGSLGLSCVVVPDSMAQQLEVRRQVWSADYAGDPQQAEAQIQPILEQLQENAALRVESRISIYTDVMGNKILALFLGLYLGFTFLLAAAAVLALQQLSQAADNVSRYAVLRRLGAEESLVARSATQQVALAFLLPLGLALIHVVVGMKAANDLIALAGKVDSVESSVVTALLLLAVYGGYFLATALACRRMARRG